MSRMAQRLTLVVLALALAAGCRMRPDRPEPAEAHVLPLQIQQRRVYPETVTGRFVSLVDFEDNALLGERGYEHVGRFAIDGPGRGAERKFVVNVTRTGVGALEANIPPGAALLHRVSQIHDFSRYTLLAMAVYSRDIRDDLRIRIATDRAAWESLPVLLRAGWNNVRIDLHRLQALKDFDARGVRSIRLWFAAAGSPVRINLDDVMLINNRREIAPLLAGMRLVKAGLDYELSLPHRPEPIAIRQGDDGLWRLGAEQAIVEVFASGAAGAATRPREDLSALGRRRLGEVEVLEHNPVRLRIASTWYFPASAGQWASLAVPKIRWEYTFCRDGRCFTDVVVNNAGGEPVSGVRLTAAKEVVWSDGRRAPAAERDLSQGGVGRFGFLTVAPGPRGRLYQEDYVKPGRLGVRMGQIEAADGDAGGDGFDESQGCYRLRAQAGHCRFVLAPAGEAMADAVVRVAAKWQGAVTANSEGLALRELVRLPDGSVLFVLPGVWSRPRQVEVTGPVELLEGR